MTYNIENELFGGEKILWQGKPATGLKLQSSDIIFIPLSLFWGGFVIFGVLSNVLDISNLSLKNLNNDQYIFDLIFGLPFVAIGLYIIFGRFFTDAKIRSNTDYAVTNQRVIISSGLFSRRIKSLNLKSIHDVIISQKEDGSGTIAFSKGPSFYNLPFSRNISIRQVPAFMMIQDVCHVYTIIKKQQQ